MLSVFRDCLSIHSITGLIRCPACKNIFKGWLRIHPAYTADGVVGYTPQECSSDKGQRYSLHVHTAYGEDGYTLHVLIYQNVGGYTQHIHTASGRKGYTRGTSTQLAVERDTPCTSTLGTAERNTSHVYTLGVGKENTPMSTQLTVDRDTHYRPYCWQ